MARTTREMLVALAGLLAFIACGKGGTPPPGGYGGGSGAGLGGGGGSSSGWSPACGARVHQAPGPSQAPYCPPIEELEAWIVGPPECPDQVYPTARELQCNGLAMPRLPIPDTIVTTELDWGNLADRPDGNRLYQQASARWIFGLTAGLEDAGVPRDFGGPPISGIPPFFQFLGPNQTVDLVAERSTVEASMRSYAVQQLRQRARGRVRSFGYGLGPHEPQPPNTIVVAELEAAIANIIGPRVELAAQVAEESNAEIFGAFPGEADILATLPRLQSVPAADRFHLVQLLVDTVRISARKHFTGKIAGASAWRYFPVDHPLYSAIDMSQISWKGFDYVEFTLLIATNDTCDPAFTTAFMAAQTAKIAQMAQRDGFRWGSAEMDLFSFDSVTTVKGLGGCTTPPRDAYLPVLDALLQGLLDAPTRPAFLVFSQGPSAWVGDAAFHEQFRQKLTAFATAIKQPK